MKKVVSVTLALVLALAFAVVAAEPSRMELNVGDKPFVCNCGEKCPCNTMAMKAGKCTCGKEMVQGTVTQASAGTAVIKIGDREQTFKTVGKYACNCGPACDCGTISQNPGNCVCGKEMAEVKKPM
jgi:hypothetical protein